MSVTTVKIPGLPATLNVNIQTKFDEHDRALLTRTWRFYNQESDKNSLIKRVEVWQDRTLGIGCLHLYFHSDGCKPITAIFGEEESKITHYHQHNFCCLFMTEPQNIQRIVQSLLDGSHQFVGDGRPSMEEIIQKLKVQTSS